MKVLPVIMTCQLTEVDRENEVEREQKHDAVSECDVGIVQADLQEAVDQVEDHRCANGDIQVSADKEVWLVLLMDDINGIVDEVQRLQ
jgi:hypothetical protein